MLKAAPDSFCLVAVVLIAMLECFVTQTQTVLNSGKKRSIAALFYVAVVEEFCECIYAVVRILL